MKKIILVSIILFSILSTTAQTVDKTESEIAQIQTEKMTTILSLTSEQIDKIYSINVDAAFKVSELKTKKNKEKEYWKKRNEIENSKRNKISNTLNGNQLIIYEKANSRYDKKQLTLNKSK